MRDQPINSIPPSLLQAEANRYSRRTYGETDMLARRCGRLDAHFASNGKMRLQSCFILITVQPFFFASAMSASLNLPIFDSAP